MGPLKGIKVVELSTTITGPLAGMMLADLGAEVIKVEKVDGGDPLRTFREGQYSPNFRAYNRNKRSLAIDLRSDFGGQVAEALFKRSDILLENFRPGVLERMGWTDERLKKLNARLIRCSISGFGTTGPYADRPCYDAVAQSLSGMLGLFLDPASPSATGPTVADNATGNAACSAILAALYERERTGVARRVDINMLEATIAFMPDPFGYIGEDGYKIDSFARVRQSQTYIFQCKDDRTICVHLSSQQKFWNGITEALGRSDLKDDPRFTTRYTRYEHYFELLALINQITRQQSSAHWLKEFARVGIPAAPVYTVEEVTRDPQVGHLDTFVKIRHPKGTTNAIRRAMYFDGRRDDQKLEAPPALGEHTNEILTELGLKRD